MTGHAGAALPPPDADAAAHSARVVAALRERLDAEGFLTFDEYMEHVLYAPGLGYYAAGSTKLGAAGDFVTAPELTPLFGRCVARQAAAVLEALGPGAQLLEFGAGSGALAAAVLEELLALGRLPACYDIVEPSPDLRERQRLRLASLPGGARERVSWLDGPPAAGFRGVILANEVLDAMPVVRFVLGAARSGDVLEQGVRAVPAPPATADAGDPGRALSLALRPARPWVVEAVRALERRLGRPLPAGYCSELAPRREAWLATVAEGLEAGLLLLIDYGLGEAEYYARERSGGTLRCHYRHRAHDDPLYCPGLQDLTAWVDFSAIARSARHCGLALAGFTTQAGFLIGNGIDALAAAAFEQAASPAARAELAARLRMLLLPGEMGERFRVLALTRGCEPGLAAFRAPDLVRTL